MKSLSLSIAAFVALIASPLPAAAQSTWNGSASSDWFTGSNWSSGVPASTVDADISNGSTGNPLIINAPGATDQDGLIGTGSGSSGSVTVTGAGTWNSTANLFVGANGSGSLLVQNGGSATSGPELDIGRFAGSTGTATVDGAGSNLVTTLMTVGYEGTGALNIQNGGSVNGTTYFCIACNPGSVGTATVDGVGSILNAQGPVIVGQSGTGTLNITNGGSVITNFFSSGYNAGSAGFTTVTGAGSILTDNGGIVIGNIANATLMVTNGGVINSSGTSGIGAAAGSTGTATVDGTGSMLNIGTDFHIGSFGTGTLTVQNGGAVSADSNWIGDQIGATGSTTVTGINSRFTTATELHVGEQGNGTLNILAGATATNGSNAWIGRRAGASGTVNVDGAGSNWADSGELFVAETGTGTLNITNGGSVSAGGEAVIGNDSGSVGTVAVTGTQSSLNAAGFLFVGNLGNGTLNIAAGGTVADSTSAVGEDTSLSDHGAATVMGAGSTWTNSQMLIVGDQGMGSLMISDGGFVSNGGIGILGNDAGSSGTATVTGAGSMWDSISTLYVGNGGTGTLTIANQGNVTTPELAMGFFLGIGTLNIGNGGAPGTLSAPFVVGGSAGGIINFNHTSTNYQFSPDISGNIAVNVLSGSTDLTGTNTYSGATTITGGTLLVDGSIQSPVSVGANGNLGGGGVIGNNVTNAGMVRPNSLSTLSVSGNYTQSGGATLNLELSPSANSLLAVAGTASLSGNLGVVFDAGSYTSRTYTLLSSGSGVSGTFSNVTYSGVPVGLTYALEYQPNDVELMVTAQTPTHPAIFASAVSSEINTAQEINGMLLNHLWEQRLGDDAVSARTSMANMAPVQIASNNQNLTGLLASAPQQLAQYGGWFRAVGNLTSVDSSGGRPGYNGGQGGFIAGLDRAISRKILVGVAVGYTQGDVDLQDGSGTSAVVKTPRAAIYGTYNAGYPVFDGTIGYAYNTIESTRLVDGTGAYASSNHSEQEITAAFQASHGYDVGRYLIAPKAGLEYARLFQPHYSESDASGFDLDVNSADYDSLRPFIGVNASTRLVDADGMVIVPEARLQYGHELLTSAPKTNVSVLGSAFAIEGVGTSRDEVSIGGGITAKLNDRFNLFADYDGAFGIGSMEHTISGGLRFTF